MDVPSPPFSPMSLIDSPGPGSHSSSSSLVDINAHLAPTPTAAATGAISTSSAAGLSIQQRMALLARGVASSAPPARPVGRVRRNSAPKGEISSLLSFWRTKESERTTAAAPAQALVREREHAEQDERIRNDRRSIIMMKEARAASKAVATAPAPAATSTTSTAPSKSTLPRITPTVLPTAGTLLSSSSTRASVASTLSPTSDADHSDRSTTSPPTSVTTTTSTMLTVDTGSNMNQETPLATPFPLPVAAQLATIVQPQPMIALPLLTRTVTDVGLELQHAEDQTPADGVKTGHGHAPSQSSVASFSPCSSANPSSLNVDGNPYASDVSPHQRDRADSELVATAGRPAPAASPAIDHLVYRPPSISEHPAAPLQASVGLTREITDLVFAQSQATSTTSSQPTATAAASMNALPPLTREITDLGSSLASSASATPAVPANTGMSSLPPLTREVTDLADQLASQGQNEDAGCGDSLLPASSQLAHFENAASPTTEAAVDSSPRSRRASQIAHASLFPSAVAAGPTTTSGLPPLTRLTTDPHTDGPDGSTVAYPSLANEPPQLMARVQTEVDMRALDAADNAPTQPTSPTRSPVQQPAFPMLTRVQTELDASAADNNDQQNAATAPVFNVAPPPMLTRMQTEQDFSGGGVEQAASASSSTIAADSILSSSIAPPPLSRLRTELEVEEQVAAPAIAEAEALTAPPLMHRVHTELDLLGGDEWDDEDAVEPIAVAAATGGLHRPSLSRLATDLQSDAMAAQAQAPVATSAAAAQPHTNTAPPQFLLTRQTTDLGEAEAAASEESAEASDLVSSMPPRTLSVDDDGEGQGSVPFGGRFLTVPPSPSSNALVAALESPVPVPPSPAASDSTEKDAAAMTQQLHLRGKVEAELVSSEATYVTNLGLLVTQFVHPLKLLSGELNVTPGQIGLIFSNVELLYGFHLIFHADLAAAVLASNSPTTTAPAVDATPSKSAKVALTVGCVILKMSDFLKMTSSYLSSYTLALDTLSGLRSNLKFQTFLQERRAATASAGAGPGLDLLSLLILPIQRIPRYLLLLKEMLRFTPKGHPELERLQQAYVKVQSIALHVNEAQRHVENMSVLLGIQNSMSSSGGIDCGQLMMPHRRLVRQAVLPKLTSGLITMEHDRKVYLFNDLLIWTEPNESSSGSGAAGAASAGEKFRGHLELEGIVVREHFAKGGRTGFRLTKEGGTASKSSKAGKDVVFLCPRGSDEKQAWMADIRAQVIAAKEAAEDARKRRADSRLKKAGQATLKAASRGAAAGAAPADSQKFAYANSTMTPQSVASAASNQSKYRPSFSSDVATVVGGEDADGAPMSLHQANMKKLQELRSNASATQQQAQPSPRPRHVSLPQAPSPSSSSTRGGAGGAGKVPESIAEESAVPAVTDSRGQPVVVDMSELELDEWMAAQEGVAGVRSRREHARALSF